MKLDHMCRNQCDQIGWFLKVLGDMVAIKRSPNAWWIFGLKWTATFLMLKYCDYFLGNFWKKLGSFLIYHLVTLVGSVVCKHWCFVIAAELQAKTYPLVVDPQSRGKMLQNILFVVTHLRRLYLGNYWCKKSIFLWKSYFAMKCYVSLHLGITYQ